MRRETFIPVDGEQRSNCSSNVLRTNQVQLINILSRLSMRFRQSRTPPSYAILMIVPTRILDAFKRLTNARANVLSFSHIMHEMHRSRGTDAALEVCHVVRTRLPERRRRRAGTRNGLLMGERDPSRAGYHGYTRNDALPG